MTDTITFDDGFDSRIEIRDLERREIYGRIIPYGQRITVRGRPEAFAPGSLAGVDTSRTKLLDHHKRAIGKLISIEERADGAYGTVRVSKTTAGDEMLELVKDGVIDSFSPGFIPDQQDADGTHRRIRALPEVSLVTFPAYPGAKVLAIREEQPMTDTTETETREEAQQGSAEFVALETRMAEMTAQFEALKQAVTAPEVRAAQPPRPIDWFGAQLEEAGLRKGDTFQTRLNEDWDRFQTRFSEIDWETRADLADITGNLPGDSAITDLSAFVVSEFMAAQLVSVLDTRRALFSRVGRFPMPRSGHAEIPVITQHSLVTARGAQKTDIPSRKLISALRKFSADWLAGGLDIALEYLRTAEAFGLEMIWSDLMKAYAKATEHDETLGIVPIVEAGGLGFSYTDAALRVDTWAHFIEDVEEQVDAVEDASDALPTKLAVTRTQWSALVGMTDLNGRRILATSGPENADAAVRITSRSFDLHGIEVFKVKGLTQAILYNEDSLKASDSGPESVNAINVQKMGHDIGVLGRTMVVPRIPEAVIVFGDDPEDS